MPPNQHFLAKADLQLSELQSGGGALLPEQALEFWKVAMKASSFLQMCTTLPMRSSEFQIPKIGMSGWTIVPAEERVALSEGDRTSPEFSKTTLSAKPFKADVRLSYDQVEENIEQGTFVETVRNLLGQAIARDLASLMIEGNTGIAAPATKKERALKKLDGMLVQTTTNLVSAGGARLSKTLLAKMVRKMPSEFIDETGMAFLTSKNAAFDYADSLANRQTAKGDSMLEKLEDAKYGKYPVVGIPLFPENLGISEDRTNAVFCNPKNFVIGMMKQITIEWDKDIAAGEFLIVGRFKADGKWRHEPATVKLQDILAAA